MVAPNMESAIAENIEEGQKLYIAGFTHSIPYAAGHEIIRQEIGNLTLIRLTPEMIYDQMITAGCAQKVVFSFADRGLRRAIEEGRIEFEEYTHFGFSSRLAAGAANLPFMPVRTFTGSDLPQHNEKIKSVENPYGDDQIYVVPPMNPDVTIAHVPRADANGNAHMWGIIGEIIDAVLAAETVILSTEEIVEEDVIRSDPTRSIIPGSAVDCVVEQPYGAHPSYVQGCYDRDRTIYQAWDDIARTEKGIQEYLDEWVYSVENRDEYIAKLDTDQFRELHQPTNYSTPIDMGYYQ